MVSTRTQARRKRPKLMARPRIQRKQKRKNMGFSPAGEAKIAIRGPRFAGLEVEVV
jgi:hypothetical protein